MTRPIECGREFDEEEDYGVDGRSFLACDTCKHVVCDECSSESFSSRVKVDATTGEQSQSKIQYVPAAHRWFECAGCGPDERGPCFVEHSGLAQPCTITRIETARSWVHCHECLHTYYGAEEQPEVCKQCYDELTSGEAVWVQEAPWSKGRVVRR